MKARNAFFKLIAVTQLVLSPVSGFGAPEAYLRSESGYLTPEEVVIGGKARKVTNPLMGTYDVEQFDDLKLKYPEAWKSFENHHRYGVAGTRGFAAGAGLAIATALTAFGKSQPVVPISLFVAGFIYGMNSRHMAKHNLHEGINKINGAE